MEEPNGVWLHKATQVPAEEPPFHPVFQDTADTAVDVPAVTPQMSITYLENSILKGIDMAESVTQPPSIYDYCRMVVVVVASFFRWRRDG